MRLTGSVSLRAVRIGFLVPPGDLTLVSRVARLSSCLWGGRYNPIIPFFEVGGERWLRPYYNQDCLSVARGYVDFFEPDVVVEASPGMAAKLGWEGEDRILGLPRVLPLEALCSRRGWAQFAAGIDIVEVMHQLYNEEYKFERRHKRLFAAVEPVEGNAFFDVVSGRYPLNDELAYVREAYRQVFDPETLPATSMTALKILKERYSGPLWITRHGLDEFSGRIFDDNTVCIFDPKNAGDVIDYWNFRLVERRVIPISIEWFAEHTDFVREHILTVHRSIPGNLFGTKFHTNVQFGGSISDESCLELTRRFLDGLPEGSFFPTRAPLLWESIPFGPNRRETKIIAAAKPISFDEEVSADGYVKLPAPSPTFFNASRRYAKARWINLILPTTSAQGNEAAFVYPSNVWSPGYPQLGIGRNLRVGREGWALQQELSIGYSLLWPQDRREAIIGWLKTLGVGAQPSEEGQVAAQVIAAAGNLLACGMFADRKTVKLLNEMAEGHSEPTRDGKRVLTTTPDRSKHINTIRQHFDERVKRSVGFWNGLNYFLERSVFRAGLRVQCPTCAYYNWLDLDAISYSPTCLRCLNQFKFSQSPQDLKRVDWFYRVVGPFAAPDYARGSYAVALTLRCFAPTFDSEMTWCTGLALKPLNCEIDFAAWYRPRRLMNDERDEPLLLFGEAKSFGANAIGDDVINSLKKVAERFPGALMVVSSLREINDYSADELRRLRELALWGRTETVRGWPRNPLVVLTAAELFSEDIYEAWMEQGSSTAELVRRPSLDRTNLYQMAELTQRRYLNLPGS